MFSAAADEHVVGAADEIIEAVGIAAEHVVSNVEAVLGQCFRRRLGQIVVAVHQCRAAHLQYALTGIAIGAVD